MADLTPYTGKPSSYFGDEAEFWRYANLVDRAAKNGKPTPAPSTVRQLDYLISMFPMRAVPFLPHRDELQRLGLSRHSAREDQIPAWSVEQCEEFIETLDRDPDFLEAVRLRMGVSS